MSLKDFFAEDSSKTAEELRRQLGRLERRQLELLRVLQRQDPALAALAAPDLAAHGFGVCSRQDEDGLILHIFRQIGAQRRTFVEIGVQDGLECNSANLSRHLGWHGLLVEGDPRLAGLARQHYAGYPGVRVEEAFVTRENAAAVLARGGADPQCDLFSLDIDGNDYWIWAALEDFRPRVVVVEYNHALGPERAVSIPYDPQFRYRERHPRGYLGASLRALQRLGNRKGYALVGCSNQGPNAFFVRREELRPPLVEVRVEEAYRPLYLKRRGEAFPETLKDLPFVEVE